MSKTIAVVNAGIAGNVKVVEDNGVFTVVTPKVSDKPDFSKLRKRKDGKDSTSLYHVDVKHDLGNGLHMQVLVYTNKAQYEKAQQASPVDVKKLSKAEMQQLLEQLLNGKK